MNYYEVLNLNQAASANEIEEAIDQEYSKWRQLVTHHDPKVASQANDALQQIEEIRVVLLDDVQRSLYDQSLGGNGNIHGLNDPATTSHGLGSSPGMMPFARMNKAEQHERTDAWICPQCKKANSIGTVFCQKCGKKIAAPCANCGNVSEIVNLFCPVCGKNKKDVFQELKEKNLIELNQSKKKLTKDKLSLQNGDLSAFFSLDSLKKNVSKSTTAIVISIIFIIIFSLISSQDGQGWGLMWGVVIIGVVLLFVAISKTVSSNNAFADAKTTLKKSLVHDLEEVNRKIEQVSRQSYESGDEL